MIDSGKYCTHDAIYDFMLYYIFGDDTDSDSNFYVITAEMTYDSSNKACNQGTYAAKDWTVQTNYTYFNTSTEHKHKEKDNPCGYTILMAYFSSTVSQGEFYYLSDNSLLGKVTSSVWLLMSLFYL